VEVYVLNATLQDYAALKEKVEQLEAEIKDIKSQNPPNKKQTSCPKRKKPKKK
jgi:cell division protein FtsB